MEKNVLYVGMMWDVITALNLEYFNRIYVMDTVDLTYGKFIEDKPNSWNTLKEKIKNILIDGYHYCQYENKNQYIKYGNAKILDEDEKIFCKFDNSKFDNLRDDNIVRCRWNLIFLFETTKHNVELIFYCGFSSDEHWPYEINNISSIITNGSSFYKCEHITTKMIKERCNVPFSYYQLYFNCDKTKFKKINKNKCGGIKSGIKNRTLFLDDIGKTIISDVNDVDHISNN